MRLLIITQKVSKNDPILGFFTGWVREFSKNCEQVTVICLEKGDYDLPENVKVLSLGKEETWCRIKWVYRFYKYIWQERKNYDNVFVHMNQIYVILGGIFWRAWGKKVGLWYAHGSVPFSLRLTEKLTNYFFTSTESGFRLKSEKKRVLGQGINTDFFKPNPHPRPFLEEEQSDGKGAGGDVFRIISVGRISPVKDYETTIEAIEILHKKGLRIKLNIIGGAGLRSQEVYLKKLKQIVVNKGLNDIIEFSGPVANHDILSFLQESDMYINTSHTGSLDKTILEAMAVGLSSLTCNEALNEVFGEYRERLMFPKKDSKEFVDKIEIIMKMDKTERERLGRGLREIVIKEHNLSEFIKKIVSELR